MKSLQLRILIIFSVLMLLSSGLIAYTVYHSSVSLITRSIGEQAHSIARYASEQIDTGRYKEISPESGETPYYRELRERLNELRQANQLKYLYTMAARDTDGRQELYYVVDGMPLGADGEDVSALGEVEEEEMPLLEEAIARQEARVGELTIDEVYGAVVSAYVPILADDGQLLGVLGADFDASGIYELLDRNRNNMLLVTGAVLLASLTIIYLFARNIVSPVRRLTSSMNTVEQGDLTPTIEIKGRDEISKLGTAFRSMVQVLRSMIQSIYNSSAHLRKSAASLSDSVEATHAASEQISRYLQEAAVNAGSQAKHTSDTVRSIDEVAIGMGRVSDTLSFVAHTTQEAADASQTGHTLLQGAIDRMEQVGRSSQVTSREMEQLAERSDQVSEMIKVIRDISEQTNLLALNASIEAARAGEHGRGFTVVAEQVRKLAVQAEQSAGRISGIVESMVDNIGRAVEGVRAESGQIGEGLKAVQSAGAAFARIRESVEQVAVEIQELSAVSEQISAGTEQVAASAAEMEQLSLRNSEHFDGIADAARQQLGEVGQMKEAAERVEAMSGELEQMARKFRIHT